VYSHSAPGPQLKEPRSDGRRFCDPPVALLVLLINAGLGAVARLGAKSPFYAIQMLSEEVALLLDLVRPDLHLTLRNARLPHVHITTA
jgi:hypothetical protein